MRNWVFPVGSILDGSAVTNLAKGDEVIAWVERHCVHVKGQWAGQSLILQPWQRDMGAMVEASPAMSKIATVYRRSIVVPRTGSVYKVRRLRV